MIAEESSFASPQRVLEAIKCRSEDPKNVSKKQSKQQLIAISNEQQINNFSEEIRVKPEHHRYLIGKNGVNIKKVREQTGARVFFPTANEESDADKDSVIITGKKEEVAKARKMLEEMISDLERVVEGEMRVEPKTPQALCRASRRHSKTDIR